MAIRARTGVLASCTAAAVCAGLVWAPSLPHRQDPPPARIAIQPDRILADGYDTAVLSIESASPVPPRISLSDSAHGVAIEETTGGGGKWQAHIRAGIVPGGLKVQVAGSAVNLELIPDNRDSAEDGMPDFLRLDEKQDQQAFRRWFTYVAEAQYFQKPADRPAEINDCAALIRYAYREALHAHDSAWADSARLPVVPAFDSVAKYQYPHTPLGASLFRVRSGPYSHGDLTNGAFLQFADARTLWRFNTHFLSRDLSRAEPGDLLFFRQESNHVTFHSMIYLGPSQILDDGRRFVLYHTGTDNEMRRLSVDELMHFPQPEWRPLASNESFLGVARWNIFRRRNGE